VIPEGLIREDRHRGYLAKNDGLHIKQVAAMSKVSVRTLHFYDETGLLKPAYVGANGYRFYEEPQLLRLQQILFYRELGFELKQINRILGRRNFEIVAALRSHRKALESNLARTQLLIETIDKTIKHLKGTKKMNNQEMFVEGEFEFHVGDKRVRFGAGESVYIPRKVKHMWGSASGKPGKIINVYQPAGKIEEFFRALGKPPKDIITAEQVTNRTYSEAQVKSLCRLFEVHGMDVFPPPGHG